jgi:aminoglycoside phosphotransferase (APT) family kinase protein
MHANQVHIDRQIAARLIHEQFPEWRDRPIDEVVTDGTMNASYRIGDDLAARFPITGAPPPSLRAQLDAEAAAMSEFADASSFAAPMPVAIGEPGDGYPLPWSVQTWIPGRVATADGCAGSVTFAHDLATLIRSLRAVDTRGRVFSGSGRGGDLHDSDEWIALCLRNSVGIVDVARVAALWARLVELPRRSPDVMSHCDLTPANVLVEGGRLIGVLDTGGFSAADAALHLVAAWHLLDRRPRNALRAELASDELEWSRGQAWALQQAMGLVRYYAESNPVMARVGRSTVARILADPIV